MYEIKDCKEERDMMQQMARMERWVNGYTNFEELKLLQWYDFSACPKNTWTSEVNSNCELISASILIYH